MLILGANYFRYQVYVLLIVWVVLGNITSDDTWAILNAVQVELIWVYLKSLLNLASDLTPFPWINLTGSQQKDTGIISF